MKDAQKPDHASLNSIISWLREGRYVIPDFQRDFEWRPWDIRDLMRSIFLDYYIGSLLLWKGKPENFKALSCEPIYGHAAAGKPEYIVLDGQQRLTAMNYVFLAPDTNLPNRTRRAFYYIRVDKFMAEEYDDAFNYEWATKPRMALMEAPEQQYESHVFPLSVVGKGGWELPNWVQGYEKHWAARHQAAKEAGDTEAEAAAAKAVQDAQAFGEHLKGITEQYQLSYIELDKDLAIDKVCDIFTQINSKGIRLDVFDLVNALLKPKGLQLKRMWHEAAPRLEFVSSEKLNVYVLQVMSILRQSYCSPKYLYFLLPGQEKPVRDPDGTRRKEVLVASIDEFKKLWNQGISALEGAIKVLRHPQEYGAIAYKYLPYVSIMPVFAALQSFTASLPAKQQLDALRKVRHWYWASVFTNRYSGSVESTSARDYMDVKRWFEDDSAEPALIMEFKQRFKNLELRKELKRGSSVYNGIFNLLVLQGASDWRTGSKPQHDDLDDHHIVPSSWGKKHLKGEAINTILNRTPLTAETNRNVINDQLPNEYLAEMIAENGEAAVRAIMETHSISPTALDILLRKPFTPDDFEEFITERQRTLQDAIETLLIKERIDLPLALRELDGRIEAVELGLRRCIERAVAGDASKLPPHVLAEADGRIQRAAKKDPAMDAEHYKQLAGKLEYFDLRELQGAITSKVCWQLLEPRFVNKESMNGKFDQLANLRNGIRHSRKVDEVTRKEGEAAILWFEQLLEKQV